MSADISMRVCAIVLAAGASQRMGRPKPLLPFGDRPMIARVMESLASVPEAHPIVVVTRGDNAEIAAALAAYRVDITVNPAPSGGMISSLRLAIVSLPSRIDAFLLLLGDQPTVLPSTIRALLDAWNTTRAAIVLPTHRGRRGHPLLFAASCAPQILALPPGGTLRAVVTANSAHIVEVETSDPSVVEDVDTPEDYERALARWRALRA